MIGAVAAQGWSLRDVDSLPVGIALPIREALHRCQADPPACALTISILLKNHNSNIDVQFFVCGYSTCFRHSLKDHDLTHQHVRAPT